MNDSYYKNKTAVVTGAGGLIGSAIAKELHRLGANVILLGRDHAKLEAVGIGQAFSVDVLDAAGLREVASQVGPVDFLINSAGGNQADATPTMNEYSPDDPRGFFDLNPDLMLDVIKINTLGTIIPSQVFGREMARRGRGAIVNFASMNSYQPLSRNLAYGVAKSGVVNFTQWLAGYLGSAGVRVNAIAPGFFVNERSRKILMTEDGGLSARGQSVMSHTPMKRFGEAHELIGCLLWLLDDERASFVTGVTVPVDGGFLSVSGV